MSIQDLVLFLQQMPYVVLLTVIWPLNLFGFVDGKLFFDAPPESAAGGGAEWQFGVQPQKNQAYFWAGEPIQRQGKR